MMRKSMKIAAAVALMSLVGTARTQATNWATDYPWGPTNSDANAYMEASQCQPSEGGYILTAVKSSAHSGYAYISGTVYDTQGYTVDSTTHYVQAYISAPTATGQWPAFWLTTQGAWTGEMDVAEWKGTGVATQNTYSSSNGWQTSGQTANHTYFKVQTSYRSSTDCYVTYYINGSQSTLDTGHNFMGKTFWIIFDNETGGDSGTANYQSDQMSFNGYSRG